MIVTKEELEMLAGLCRVAEEAWLKEVTDGELTADSRHVVYVQTVEEAELAKQGVRWMRRLVDELQWQRGVNKDLQAILTGNMDELRKLRSK